MAHPPENKLEAVAPDEGEVDPYYRVGLGMRTLLAECLTQSLPDEMLGALQQLAITEAERRENVVLPAGPVKS